MPTFQVKELQEISTRIFQGAGSPNEEARLVSRYLNALAPRIYERMMARSRRSEFDR